MSVPADLLAEIEVLNLYPDGSIREGIKVHHDASPELVAAARRLFEKGIISQEDGGYLSSLGIDAVEHVHGLLTILTSKVTE